MKTPLTILIASLLCGCAGQWRRVDTVGTVIEWHYFEPADAPIADTEFSRPTGELVIVRGPAAFEQGVALGS